MIASQLSGHCDLISNQLWCHQQNENWASETRDRCVKIVVSIVISAFVMSCKKYNNVCTRVTELFQRSREGYFGVYFPKNKHQNNPLVSAETVRHLSAYIILYISNNIIVLGSWQHISWWFSHPSNSWLSSLSWQWMVNRSPNHCGVAMPHGNTIWWHNLGRHWHR